jgi:Phosphodiester glycosidase
VAAFWWRSRPRAWREKIRFDMPGDGTEYELTRLRLRDGRETTVYLVRYQRASTDPRLIRLPDARRLDVWCAEHDQPEAIVAGFFLRDPYRPLGDVRVGGENTAYEPIQEPWGPRRAAIHIDGDIRLAPRGELPDEPSGDLVAAGPMLVAGGRSLIDGEDREGFSAGAAQFDSDITAERHPRCALGLTSTQLFAVACDGRRTGVDAGLDLAELARLMIAFGCEDAINLDGGGSATLVHRGHLLNRPYSSVDQPAPESQPVVTAILFQPASPTE